MVYMFICIYTHTCLFMCMSRLYFIHKHTHMYKYIHLQPYPPISLSLYLLHLDLLTLALFEVIANRTLFNSGLFLHNSSSGLCVIHKMRCKKLSGHPSLFQVHGFVNMELFTGKGHRKMVSFFKFYLKCYSFSDAFPNYLLETYLFEIFSHFLVSGEKKQLGLLMLLHVVSFLLKEDIQFIWSIFELQAFLKN